jgi:hypothetical protein
MLRPIAVITLLVWPTVARAQKILAACEPVIDAERKGFSTPTHIYSTEKGGKGRSTETIFVDGASYVFRNGGWRKSPMTPKDLLGQLETNLKTTTAFTCQRLPDESVAGEAATVYRSHMENQGVKSDAQIWISKSSGLVLKQEEDLDDGAGDRRHLSLRYEYTNVRAPAGTK